MEVSLGAKIIGSFSFRKHNRTLSAIIAGVEQQREKELQDMKEQKIEQCVSSFLRASGWADSSALSA